MNVFIEKDGSFAFVFQPDEKALGIKILESFVTRTEEEKKNVADSILAILFASNGPPTMH